MKFRSLIESSLAEQLQRIAENLRIYAQETNEYLQSSTGEGLKNIQSYNSTATYIQEGDVKNVTTILHTLDNDARNVILDMIRTESPIFGNIIQLNLTENKNVLISNNQTALREWTWGGAGDVIAAHAKGVWPAIKKTAVDHYGDSWDNLKDAGNKIGWAVANPLDAIDYGEHERDYWMDTEDGLAHLKDNPWKDPQYTKEQRLAMWRDHKGTQVTRADQLEQVQSESEEGDEKVIFGPKTGKESYPMGYSDEGRFHLYVVRDLLPRIKDIDLAANVWKTLEKFDERRPNISKEDIELIMTIFDSAQKQGLIKRYMSARKVPVRNTEESVHVYEDCGCGGDMGGSMVPAPEAAPQFKLYIWNPMTGQLMPLEVSNVEDMGPIDDFHTSYSGEY
jgi:hypothetical protein